MIDVLCIGHAAFDLIARIDQFPQEDRKYETGELYESGGGPAANAAYLLAKWGLRTAFAGVVGDDVHGLRARDELAAAGVDVSLLEVRPGHRTPGSLILVNRQNGSRTIVNRKLPTPPLSLASRWPAAWAPRVRLFDGHELQASFDALNAFPQARTILDAGSWREGTIALVSAVHYLAASERFAARLVPGRTRLDTEEARRECLRQMRAFSPALPIVTLGERGLIYDPGEGLCELPAFPSRTVDSTAAGDFFHGALAYGLARELPLAECLRLASMAASLSVRSVGGRDSAPLLPDVEAALRALG
jgi:sugar/nucleoside kinase (ribokinase family)